MHLRANAALSLKGVASSAVVWLSGSGRWRRRVGHRGHSLCGRSGVRVASAPPVRDERRELVSGILPDEVPDVDDV
jgi:hypothetical protein